MDRLFDLLPPLDVGEPEAFLTQAVAIFASVPEIAMERAVLDPEFGIPVRSDRPTLKLIRETLDKICEKLKTEEDRIARAKEARPLMLPRPPRTAEEQARIDKLVEDFRKSVGIPPGGYRRQSCNPNLPEPRTPGDGRHAERVMAQLAERRIRSTA